MLVNNYGEKYEILDSSIKGGNKGKGYTIIRFSDGTIVKEMDCYVNPLRTRAIINPNSRIVAGYGYLGMTRKERRKIGRKYYSQWYSFINRNSSEKVDEYFHSFANFCQWCTENKIDIDNDYLALIDKKIVKVDKRRHGYMPIKVVRIVPYAKVGIPFDSINEYSRECGIKQSSSNLSTLDNVKINDNGDILMTYENAIQFLEKIGGRLVDETE